MNIDIPLDLYKVFYTVVKTGNMSQAAKVLYISQPAVSMAIRQLENKLGGSLLIRTPKGVRPTSEGKVLYTYLDQALNLISTAEKKYMEVLNLESGEIQISASDSILNYFMMPYLEAFNNIHKNVNVKVTNRTTDGTLNILKRGEVDIGFINLPISDSNQLEVKKIKELQDVLIGGKHFKHLAKTGVNIEDLCNYPLIMFEKDSNTRKYIDDYALEHGVVLNPIFELGASDLILKFARINFGLFFQARQFAEKEIDGVNLFEIPLNPPIPKRHIGIVKLKSISLSNAAKKFIEMF